MLELLVKIRSELGRQASKVREENLIPAVLYGPGVKNLNLSINYNVFKKAYQEAGESALIKLKIKDGETEKERVVLINDTDRDPVTDHFIHVDFKQIKMDKLIKVEVPFIFIGESEAVKTEGGVLVKSIQSIEVEVLPLDLIHEIEVDISKLETFDDNIYIKDLKIPDTIKLAIDPEEVIASVIPPRSEEELETLEETPVESVEDIEVEEKGKDKEEVEQADVPKQENPKEE